MMSSELPDYSAEFQELLAAEGLTDLRIFASAETFDEVPIYSRYTQLDFLGRVPVAARNRAMILAAVRHLDRIDDHFRANGGVGERILRMVSVTSGSGIWKAIA